MSAKAARRARKKVKLRATLDRPRLICANCRQHVPDVLGTSDTPRLGESPEGRTGLVTTGPCPSCCGEYGVYAAGQLERALELIHEQDAMLGVRNRALLELAGDYLESEARPRHGASACVRSYLERT